MKRSTARFTGRWSAPGVRRRSFDKLRMAFLFVMVSLSNHPPHLNPLPRRGEED